MSDVAESAVGISGVVELYLIYSVTEDHAHQRVAELMHGRAYKTAHQQYPISDPSRHSAKHLSQGGYEKTENQDHANGKQQLRTKIQKNLFHSVKGESPAFLNQVT
jgi:hypothetical protein